jgi:hypothetical protein
MIFNSIEGKEKIVNDFTKNRIKRHLKFVGERKIKKGIDSIKYINEYYSFPVMTRQELKIKLPLVNEIIVKDRIIEVSYLEG